MRKLFFVSLNGVLYDSIGRVIDYLRHRWNYIMKPGEVTTNDLSRFTGVKEIDIDLVKQISNPDFYLDMQPMEGAWEAVEILSQFGDIVSVTRRPSPTRMVTRMCATRDFGPYIKDIFHQRNGPKVARHLRASCVVEDNPTLAEEYAASRIVTFVPSSQYSKGIKVSRYLKTCDSLLDMAKQYEQAYTKTSWSD
jgi:5'(3')-deoxyribonucleotidase